MYIGEDEEPDAQFIPEPPRVPRNVPANERVPESLKILQESLTSGYALEQFEVCSYYTDKPSTHF